MTPKKEAQDLELDSRVEDAKIIHEYQYEYQEDEFAVYKVEVEDFNVSPEGLMGRITLTKNLKRMVVVNHFFSKKKSPKIKSEYQWDIKIKYGEPRVLLTNQYEPATMNDGTHNYKLNLINMGLNRLVETNDGNLLRPIRLPRTLINNICEGLDEQLIDKYKHFLK